MTTTGSVTMTGLGFEFTAEQEELRQRVRAFAMTELAPNATRWASGGQLPMDAVAAMGREGLLGFTFPPEVGGQGRSWVDFAIVLEEIGRADISCAWICGMGNSYPKVLDDPDALAEIIRGEKVLAFAETEPQAGGDAAAIKTTAIRQGDGWVIEGNKTYVSLVPGAQLLLVTALTDPGAGRKGMSMFLVDADAPGVTITEIPEPGVKAHMLGTIVFDQVEVGADRLVGEENDGFRMMRTRWDYTRGVGATRNVGAALQSLDETVVRAKEKHTFGKPLLKWEAIQFKLVDGYTRMEAARLLAYKSAWLADQGQRVTAYASMLKTYVADACRQTVMDCLDIWGGAAFREDHPIFRRFLDIRGFQAAGGGQDIHRIILGTELFGREYAAHRD